MASIIDKYKNSEFAKLGKSTKDKTPYSADSGNKLHQDEKALAQARMPFCYSIMVGTTTTLHIYTPQDLSDRHVRRTFTTMLSFCDRMEYE